MFPGTCSSPMRWLPWGEAGSGRGCRYPKHGITTKVWKRMLAMYTQSSGDTCPGDWIGRMGTNIEAFGMHCLCLEDIVQAGGILSELGEHCLCLENIVQAVRILKQLESNFLPTPATQIEPSMATGWREIRIKGIQVKNMNFVCKKILFFRERSLFFK